MEDNTQTLCLLSAKLFSQKVAKLQAFLKWTRHNMSNQISVPEFILYKKLQQKSTTFRTQLLIHRKHLKSSNSNCTIHSKLSSQVKIEYFLDVSSICGVIFLAKPTKEKVGATICWLAALIWKVPIAPALFRTSLLRNIRDNLLDCPLLAVSSLGQNQPR